EVLVLAVHLFFDLVDVHSVPDGVDSCDMRAGAQRYQNLCLAPDLVDPLHAMGGADGALDKGDLVVVSPVRDGLPEIDELHELEDAEQVVFQVELGKLAAFAGGEIEERDLWPAHCMASFRSRIFP